MVIKHIDHTGIIVSMNRIDKNIFSFVIENAIGVLESFIGDIYDLRIVDCVGNELFLEDIKKDSK